MSQFSGRQGRGARRHRAETKRAEAETRNKAYRDNLELQEKLANSDEVREGAVNELVAEME